MVFRESFKLETRNLLCFKQKQMTDICLVDRADKDRSKIQKQKDRQLFGIKICQPMYLSMIEPLLTPNNNDRDPISRLLSKR